MPFFSIIIPTYNRAQMISAAVESVIAQKFTDWELIIIDDGSTDDTGQIIKKYKDPRIKYYWQENKERSAARNYGIELSAGRYVCFLDSDDLYLPDHLQNFHSKLEQLDFPLCFMFSDIFTGEPQTGVNSYSVYKDNNPLERIFYSLICIIQVCISRAILTEEKFDEKIHLGEDLELWSRIVVKYPLIYLNAQTVFIRDHNERSIYSGPNPFKQNLDLAQKIFNAAGPNKISRDAKRVFTARCYYGMAKGNIHEGKYWTAFFQVVRSFFFDPGKQGKHKAYLAFAIMFHRKKANEMIIPNNI